MKGFYFNQDSCAGCRTCQAACKDKNNLEIGVIYRRVESYETGTFPKASVFQLSRTCNHCSAAECVRVCPVGAMYLDEEDGTIQHDDELCIGCQSCVNACPYGVPQYRPELTIVGKCDGCKTLRENGMVNACVAACPLRALDFGEIDELMAKYPNAVDCITVLPEASGTQANILINAKAGALEGTATPITI